MSLGMYTSVGPDVMHPRIPKELADMIARLFSIVLEKLWLSGKDLHD